MPRGRPKKTKNEKIEYKNETERKDRLKQLLRETNKKLGIEDAVKYGKDSKDWEKLSTGVPAIDDLLGGGFPYGHFSVLWGGKGAGKTSLCYSAIAQAQKEGKIVYYIDLEESFEKTRAEQFGINVDDLIIGEFPVAEQCLDTIIKYSKEKVVDVIILDSIHSLSPSGEQTDKKGEKSVEADTMALLARKLSQFFRMAINPVAKGNVAVILVGQTRTSVGFIALDQLTGGNALKHYSVLTLNIRRGQKSDAPRDGGKTTGNIIGFDTKVKVDKTKTPGTKSELTEIHLPFYYSTGWEKDEK